MKKIKLFILTLFAFGVTAQGANLGDVAALKVFLSQGTNYSQLGIAHVDSIDTYDWHTAGNGLTWDGSDRLQDISWENKSFTGTLDVRDCTNLQTLLCNLNNLTGLDVTGLLSLTTLNCESNSLTSLDLMGCATLQNLSCSSNQLTSLDVSSLTSLQMLKCNDNTLSTLTLSGAASLLTLLCENNNISSLDASGLNSLVTLTCSKNGMSTLNVSGSLTLDALNCDNNQLSTLDVSTLSSLTTLACHNNSLSSLDVTNNTNLSTLSCESNNFLFSTLPPASGISTYTYSPQSDQSITANYDNVDISSEYSIGGNITTYDWGSVTAAPIGNGIFNVTATEAGQVIPCLLTNASFPALTLTYNVSVNAQMPTTIALTDSTVQYTGSPIPGPTATTSPAGLTVTYTYNGSATIPVDVGTYSMVATFAGDASNAPSTSNTAILTITKATAVITAQNKRVTYDGNPQPLDPATTIPAGLPVTYSYNTTPPTDAGEYTVIVTFAGDANHEPATDTATITIDKLTPDLSMPNKVVMYDANPQSVTISTIPAGIPITYLYNGSSTPPINIGMYMVEASFAGDSNLNPVMVTGSLQIIASNSLPIISLHNTNVNYNGQPQTIEAAVIIPEGLPITYTYNGSTTPPTNAGVYTVIASFPGDDQYTAVSDTATLTIEKVIPFLSIFNNFKVYTGQPQGIDPALTIPAGLPITYTYNRSSEMPTDVGTYRVTAFFAENENYFATSLSATLVISQAGPSIYFADQIVEYNGAPQAIAPASTIPEGLPLTYTYNGFSEIPSKIGTYQVVAIFEGNDTYSPVTSSAVYRIDKIMPTVELEPQVFKYDGTPPVIKPATVTGTLNPSDLAVKYEYAGTKSTVYPSSTNTPSGLGTYIVIAATDETDIYYAAKRVAVMIINQTGTTGILDVPEAKVYLAEQMLNISTPKAETISVYTISGARLYSAPKQADEELMINTSTWPKGVLIVVGNSGWGTKVMNK